MSRLVVLDSGPLGLLVMDPKGKKARGTPAAARCVVWVDRLVETGTIVAIPEIIRFELRRELVLKGFAVSLERLDELCYSLAFSPIADPVMDRASDLWAEVRRRGKPTADDKALDVDAILAAQALVEAEAGQWDQVIIATTNVEHLSRFPGVKAEPWERIL